MTVARRELLRLEVPFGALGGAVVILAVVFAVTGIPSWIPPAPTVRLGIPSPLTGMTRSFVATASADMPAALRLHPLGPATFALCAALPLIAIASWVRGRRVATFLGSGKAWAAAGLTFGAAWLSRLF